uniref:Uncharacterized protein n=1 Tax=Ciona savignyi TaxID=51511 RepID=H2ZQ28_CIOSA
MYMAIKAMDELSNIAPTSNIVRIVYQRRTTSTSRTRCKECNGVRSLEECDRRGTVRTCQRQDVCSMEVRINGGRRTISVFCKQKQACKNELQQNNQQCRRNMQNKTCRCCCEKPSCNATNFTCITTYNNFQ